MDALQEHVIPGTEHVRSPDPFFSPDGTWVGFYAGGRLQKISIRGGEPITICETDAPMGVSWGQDDAIVFGQGSKGIHRVSSVGGEPEVLVEVEEDKGELALGGPLGCDRAVVDAGSFVPTPPNLSRREADRGHHR